MKIISNSLLRSFVGFEALFDELDKVSDFKETNYPAYNIEKTDEKSFIISKLDGTTVISLFLFL